MKLWKWFRKPKIESLELKRITVRDGDVIVVKSPRPVSHAVSVRIGEYLREVFPNQKILVMDDLDLYAVVSREAK